MSWLRPSKSSGRFFRPSGPTKRYSFSTACHGSARRAAASWSRLRVSAFSFASSFLRAVVQAFSETTGRRLVLGCDTACLREVPLPVWRVQPVVAHVLAGRRRVDEAAIAQVDADVRVLLPLEVEEEEIAAPHARQPDRARDLALRIGAARESHAHLPIAVLHEPAAVEAGGDRGAAKAIGAAAQGGGLCCGAVAERGAHFGRRRLANARARACDEKYR